MEIAKTYDPKTIENKWYSHWLAKKYFRSVPDEREPYTIVIPPPNVTGVLHMGHMLNNTIQDVLIRRARMLGKNACWVPGTDHASIATEAKVVAMLKEQGINKSDLTRDEFLKYAWEWKDKYGGIILKQLEKLGASCDWDRTRFTMEDDLSEAVIDVFIDLYNKGHIYRGVRMVNWDPAGLTAVSDEEVIHKEVNSKLYYVKYIIVDADEKIDLANEVVVNDKLESGSYITVATVRPETILGDTGVCVHPDDERYKKLKGKFAVIPFVNREVPIIFDDYIMMEFGTGALKVTPAHDINDYNLGIKHNLPVIDTLNPNGTMSEAAGFYVGKDRFEVRKQIVKDLEAKGHIAKVEDYKNKVGYSERTNAVIEPRLSMQWFLKMQDISKPALENVLNGNIKLIPDKFINTYKHWMESVHDWCISRQLWWGQRIPAWYDDKGNFVVAKTASEAIKLFMNPTPNSQGNSPTPNSSLPTIKQDEDVLDTWFSSWLWPISVFDGFKNPDGKDINYYYPTNDLITAPEILFFWVARMIIAGYEYRLEKPFTNVYLTGIVRDKQGRKMSKSLGNSPDPIELIEKFGADGVRVGMLLCSPAGNDLMFDESYCEQGRNFCNKIWNAFRLVKGWSVDNTLQQSYGNKIAVEWFDNRLKEQVVLINELYDKYRMSEMLMTTYKLVWDDFCAWYLEIIKPDFVDGNSLAIDSKTFESTISFFESLLKLLHPLMPFISEEIWHLLKERNAGDDIIIAAWPKTSEIKQSLLIEFDHASNVVTEVRNIRKSKNISPKEKISLFQKTASGTETSLFDDIIKKLCNLDKLETTQTSIENAISFVVKQNEYFIPFNSAIDINAEKERLQKELDYTQGFLNSVMVKLGNERFVANAKPEILANENKKKADAEARINAIKEVLANI